MAEKVLMIALSPTMESGTIGNWIKKEGDQVSSGDVLCEVETDKATMDYESLQEGVLLKILVPEGASADLEQPIAVIGDAGEDISSLLTEITAAEKPETKGEEPVESPVQELPVQGSYEWIPSSPLARIAAEQAGIDLSTVPGTGPGGRIVKRDVEKAGKRGTAARPLLMEETRPVSQKRKIIARRLAESKFSAPHYYLRLSVAMDGMMKARKDLNARRKDKVSLNAFLIKFAAEAVRRHPVVNSSWGGDTIATYGNVDIGLAVAQHDGLITPVVRNCDSKGLLAIEEELKDLILRAQNNKLQPDEYSGATFTVTNLGSYGIEEFTAIINPPGSAILAVGSIKKEIVIDEQDNQEVRSIMRLTLSCDHRVIDGAEGAAFLKDLKDFIEDPVKILY